MMQISLGKKLKGAKGIFQLDVQMSVGAGEIVALMGSSGSGKTSILRMLAGLMKPSYGHITIGDVCYFDAEKRINVPPQKRQLGYVFQDYALFPNMTVRENLSFALPEKGKVKIVDELIEMMELQSLQHQKPAFLSGGQQQRTALARALVRKPHLLLLDEPLSALDQRMRQALQDQLVNLSQAWGLSMILVSHDPVEVARLAQKMLILEEGKIIDMGTPGALLSSKLSPLLHGKVLSIAPDKSWMSVLLGREILRLPYRSGVEAAQHIQVNIQEAL